MNRKQRDIVSFLVLLGVVAIVLARPIISGSEADAFVPARPSTLTVTSTGDSGPGTLRQAITDASSGDLIDFSIRGTIALTSGPLTITKNLTINGPGSSKLTISGHHASRVLTITLATSVAISGVTIRDGKTSGDGGGIYNSGVLALCSTTITGNTATAKGGGIYNAGMLTLTNSTVSDNIQSGSNAEDGGGGIYNVGTLILTDSTVSGNLAARSSGGIHNFRGTLILTNSTVNGNGSDGWYGGILNHVGTATLTNCTVSGNKAQNSAGGIINSSGRTTLFNCTISGNKGGVFIEAGSVQLGHTIIAGNLYSDCGGSYTSLGHNLIGNSSGCRLSAAAGDRVDIDPKLGPLQDNGGPTLTHALLPGSPAIDAGGPHCSAPETDQRGVARPQGAACDIGAYEAATVRENKPSGPSSTPSSGPWGFSEMFSFSLGEYWCENHVAIADFDHDGLKDIALLATTIRSTQPKNSYTCKLVLLRNQGKWQFTSATVLDIPENHYGYALQSQDLNHDGWADLVFHENATTHVLLNNKTGCFKEAWTRSSETGDGYFDSLHLSDVNNDGFADILSGIQSGKGGKVEVLLNNGSGTKFSQSWESRFYGSSPYGTISNILGTMLNEDKAPDIVATEVYSGTLVTFTGKGTGKSFAQRDLIQLGGRTFGLAVGKVNSDALADVAVWAQNKVQVFVAERNHMAPYWQCPDMGRSSGRPGFADFDQDGYDDLFVRISYRGALRVYRNRPNVGFELVWSRPLPEDCYIGTISDLDGDGYPDLIVGERDAKRQSYLRILRNNLSLDK